MPPEPPDAAADDSGTARLTLIVASATVQNKASYKNAAYEIGRLMHHIHHQNDTTLDKPIQKNVSSPHPDHENPCSGNRLHILPPMRSNKDFSC